MSGQFFRNDIKRIGIRFTTAIRMNSLRIYCCRRSGRHILCNEIVRTPRQQITCALLFIGTDILGHSPVTQAILQNSKSRFGQPRTVVSLGHTKIDGRKPVKRDFRQERRVGCHRKTDYRLKIFRIIIATCRVRRPDI